MSSDASKEFIDQQCKRVQKLLWLGEKRGAFKEIIVGLCGAGGVTKTTMYRVMAVVNPSADGYASNWYHKVLHYLAESLHPHLSMGMESLFPLHHVKYIEALASERALKPDGSDTTEWKLDSTRRGLDTQANAICDHFLREAVDFFTDLRTVVPKSHSIYVDVVVWCTYFQDLQK